MTGGLLRILVYPHAMEIGGSQTNAIELGAALRDRGHEVAVYCDDGPLLGMVARLGLQRIEARRGYFRPSPTTALHLGRVARDGDFDVVHAYEWPPSLEAYLVACLSRRRAAVTTVMSMAVAPFIPSSMPLVVGTERIRCTVAPSRAGATALIEPPIDTAWNSPGSSGDAFRKLHGLDMPLVVVVSRLAHELKLEGLLTLIRAVGRLSAVRPVRLVVVGDGPARPEVEAAISAAGREAVLLTGLLDDPRPAYDAADVVVGMGGSALRGMAFAKPLVVQGEQGFFALLSSESVAQFLSQGWYGTGDGDTSAAEDKLVALLASLLDEPERRRELGAFGRSLVQARYCIERAATIQEQIYYEALVNRPGPARRLGDGVDALSGLLAHKARRRLARAKGRAPVDDFNAKPL